MTCDVKLIANVKMIVGLTLYIQPAFKKGMDGLFQIVMIVRQNGFNLIKNYTIVR